MSRGDFDDRCGRANFTEHSAVDAGDLFPLAHIRNVHPRTNHVLEFAAERFDGGLNDGERAGGLFTDRARIRAIGVDADAPGHGDRVAAAHGAAIAHDRLPLRTARSALAADTVLDGDFNVGHDLSAFSLLANVTAIRWPRKSTKKGETSHAHLRGHASILFFLRFFVTFRGT